jgi:lantibiotic modifying enzyme
MSTAADMNIILTDINKSLAKQVDAIARQLFDKKTELNETGLLGGKAGIVLLFAYLAKLFPGKEYFSNTLEYLDDLSNALANDELDHSMSGGVAGIAFAFQHLRNIGILDLSDDLNLSELDEFINVGIDNDFINGNWDPLHGMTGLGIYFLERNKETDEKKYLEKIVDHLAALRTAVGEYKVWITPGYEKIGNDNYNFGMAHGMPGVLSFLAQVYSRGIKQKEIEEMISACLPFLLQHEFDEDPVFCFPTFVDVAPKEKEKTVNSHHAWCYGDLCMANALVHCGRPLQRNDWKNKGIDVALKTTHRTFENAGCSDATFCHGTVGLAHQYNRFYQLTGNEVFKYASDTWLRITQEQFYQPGEGAGGYYFRTFNKEKDIFEMTAQYGLLEGSAGIALVYLSCLYHIKPDWDIFFLPMYKIKNQFKE